MLERLRRRHSLFRIVTQHLIEQSMAALGQVGEFLFQIVEWLILQILFYSVLFNLVCSDIS